MQKVAQSKSPTCLEESSRSRRDQGEPQRRSGWHLPVTASARGRGGAGRAPGSRGRPPGPPRLPTGAVRPPRPGSPSRGHGEGAQRLGRWGARLGVCVWGGLQKLKKKRKREENLGVCGSARRGGAEAALPGGRRGGREGKEGGESGRSPFPGPPLASPGRGAWRGGPEPGSRHGRLSSGGGARRPPGREPRRGAAGDAGGARRGAAPGKGRRGARGCPPSALPRFATRANFARPAPPGALGAGRKGEGCGKVGDARREAAAWKRGAPQRAPQRCALPCPAPRSSPRPRAAGWARSGSPEQMRGTRVQVGAATRKVRDRLGLALLGRDPGTHQEGARCR